jgi:MFS family permease
VKKLPFNVWLLMCVGALSMSAASFVVITAGLIGSDIAPSSALATLPLAMMIVGTATSVIPVTMMMQRIGRKTSFIIGSGISIVGTLLAAFSIVSGVFSLLCLATFIIGTGLAFVQQFRFAAMESVAPKEMPNAAAKVLLGGLIAAYIGPELALRSKDMFTVPFAGAYVVLACLYFLSMLLLFLYRPNKEVDEKTELSGRPLKSIMSQPVFWAALLSAAIAYAVMSFIMTATPMSMHMQEGHSLEDTKWVIQSHIMAMYIPSFFSGWLINRFGIAKIMFSGLLAFVLCIGIAMIDRSLMNYWLALILLGIGWNFLFVGGTALLPQSYRKNERFKAQAVNEFSVFAVQALASLSSGWVLYQYGWEVLLLVSLPLLITASVAILWWKNTTVNKLNENYL